MNYESLLQIPTINNVSVIGDRRFEDFGLIPISSAELTEIMLEIFGYVL